MSKFLAKIFIKDYKNISDEKVRAAYGKLSGIVGVITNLILCSIKIITGFLIGSVSVLADGINNLSDAGSSVITLIGFKMSSAPADKDHPYGHQRIEYVTGLIVSFIILLIGFILMRSSINKILHPEIPEISWYTIIILVVSIFAKYLQSRFYRNNGKLIDSKTLIATSVDSLNDTITTTAVLISCLIFLVTKVDLDAYMGILVSVFILFSGLKLIKETISLLIGEAPSKEFIHEVSEDLLSYRGVLGIHDLVIHSYGPRKTFMTVHVEVDSDVNIIESHDVIDNIEQDFQKKYDVNLVIHMDPIETHCELTLELKQLTQNVLNEIDPELRFHDFRVVKGKTHTNLIFDVVMPINYKMGVSELKEVITTKIKKINSRLKPVITVDQIYIGED